MLTQRQTRNFEHLACENSIYNFGATCYFRFLSLNLKNQEIFMKIILSLMFWFWGFAYAELPLDLSFEEMREIYRKNQPEKSFNKGTPSVSYQVQQSIVMGENLFQWLKLINKHRSESDQLRLTSKSSSGGTGIPVDRPMKYGEKTISKNFSRVIAQFPKEFTSVLSGKTPISPSTIIDEKTFIKCARYVSVLYSRATRYSLLIKWKDHYIKNAQRDIRHFYYLKNIPDLDNHLRQFNGLDSSTKKKTTDALMDLCMKAKKDESYCAPYLEKFISSNRLVAYKNIFWRFSLALWDSFFKISQPRTDIEWKNDTLTIPFYAPQISKISYWLKSNVEEEFQWEPEAWKLELSFTDQRSKNTSYIEFQPNQTPHVSGGNKIVMDANTAIEEYGTRWTIRHEFGHILRFPDCYHEFYDPKEEVFVNYQLDVTDLMCSRSGKMNERIYKELKRVYSKKSGVRYF